MNISELVEQQGAGGALDALSNALGLDKQQAASMMDTIGPMLLRGLRHRTSSDQGLESFRDALQTGNHGNYLDNPSVLQSDDAYNDGRDILGHIFGDKQVSRDVAAHASKQTGIGESLIKQALPLIAGLLMGALNKQSNAGQDLGRTQAQSNPLGPLASIFDQDRDGHVLDDIIGMAGKYA